MATTILYVPTPATDSARDAISKREIISITPAATQMKAIESFLAGRVTTSVFCDGIIASEAEVSLRFIRPVSEQSVQRLVGEHIPIVSQADRLLFGLVNVFNGGKKYSDTSFLFIMRLGVPEMIVENQLLSLTLEEFKNLKTADD